MAGPATATVNVRFAGESNYASLYPDHHTRIACGTYTKDTIYDGYQLNNFNFQLPITDLSSSTTNLTASSINDLGAPSNPDNTAVVFAYIKYPHIVDMESLSSFEFFLPDNTSQSKAFINVSNFNDLGAGSHLFDLTNHKYIPVVKSGAMNKAIIPNGANEKKCYITSVSNIHNVITLFRAGNNGTFTNFSTNAPDSAFILSLIHI